MKIINRRRFLGSLAASTACGEIALTESFRPNEQGGAKQPNNKNGSWFLMKQNREPPGVHVVDFWSKPVSDIEYASKLPSGIVRGSLWYDSEPCTDLTVAVDLNYVDSILEQERSVWLTDRCLVIQRRNKIENFPELLLSALGEKVPGARGRRTALIALDSLGPATADLDWADMLPAFRRCYHRVIGHFRIERRGFHHWEQWLSNPRFDVSYFERFFTKTATQCDAVILTSQSLAENDVHLPARASTESLIGELTRRFGQVLLDDVLAEIAPIGASPGPASQPRIFALGSAGASATAPRLEETDLLRQRELVFSSFGRPITCPLLIATQADEGCAESIRNQIKGSDIKFLTTQISTNQENDGEFQWFEFATLWPFDPDYGPWP
jgi:hypothetical protein